jgi:hypothetical protein
MEAWPASDADLAGGKRGEGAEMNPDWMSAQPASAVRKMSRQSIGRHLDGAATVERLSHAGSDKGTDTFSAGAGCLVVSEGWRVLGITAEKVSVPDNILTGRLMISPICQPSRPSACRLNLRMVGRALDFFIGVAAFALPI